MWLAHADESSEGCLSEACQRLTSLFLVVVDSPKTGNKVNLDGQEKGLLRKSYPDFMEVKGKASYESKKVHPLFCVCIWG